MLWTPHAWIRPHRWRTGALVIIADPRSLVLDATLKF